jgi:hypothetical protein
MEGKNIESETDHHLKSWSIKVRHEMERIVEDRQGQEGRGAEPRR